MLFYLAFSLCVLCLNENQGRASGQPQTSSESFVFERRAQPCTNIGYIFVQRSNRAVYWNRINGHGPTVLRFRGGGRSLHIFWAPDDRSPMNCDEQHTVRSLSVSSKSSSNFGSSCTPEASTIHDEINASKISPLTIHDEINASKISPPHDHSSSTRTNAVTEASKATAHLNERLRATMQVQAAADRVEGQHSVSTWKQIAFSGNVFPHSPCCRSTPPCLGKPVDHPSMVEWHLAQQSPTDEHHEEEKRRQQEDHDDEQEKNQRQQQQHQHQPQAHRQQQQLNRSPDIGKRFLSWQCRHPDADAQSGNCQRIPIFGPRGSRTGLFCKKHKRTGDVDVRNAACRFPAGTKVLALLVQTHK